MESLLDSFAEIKVLKESDTLSARFLKFVPHESFVKILEREYELIRRHHLHKCSIDLRQIPVYDKGSVEYVKSVWFSKVEKLGVRYTAFIQPQTALGEM